MALSEKHVTQVCKRGQNEAACAFLVFDPENGMSCAKGTPLQGTLIHRRVMGKLRSRGDNCSGPPSFTPYEAPTPAA